VTVDYVWPEVAEDAEKTHCGAGDWALANDMDRKAFCAEHFEQRTHTAIGADGNVVPVGTLHAAKLEDEYLRTSHLQTVDNMNYFHAGMASSIPV
jgi:hypothetical protein